MLDLVLGCTLTGIDGMIPGLVGCVGYSRLSWENRNWLGTNLYDLDLAKRCLSVESRVKVPSCTYLFLLLTLTLRVWQVNHFLSYARCS